MGIYINPTNGQSKEEWLNERGEKFNYTTEVSVVKPLMEHHKIIVCLVVNGMFTAAAVAFDNSELRAFANPNDLRPKTWYMVHIDKLLDHSGISERVLRAVGLKE